MRRVIIESPYHGNVERNLRYLRVCLRDSLLRGRRMGIEAGFSWWADADSIVFYTDIGWSRGMTAAHDLAVERVELFEFRTLGGEWSSGT